jgi:Arm DNA-binding domain
MGTLGNRLTDVRCRAAGVGVHGDGGGLALQVQPGAHGNRRNWIFRYMIAGRARTMGLGSYPDITLRRAREKAQECRRLKAEGVRPDRTQIRCTGLPAACGGQATSTNLRRVRLRLRC